MIASLEELIKVLSDIQKQKPKATVLCREENDCFYEILEVKYDPGENEVSLIITDEG